MDKTIRGQWLFGAIAAIVPWGVGMVGVSVVSGAMSPNLPSRNIVQTLSFRPLFEFDANSSVWDVCFSPDGRTLATAAAYSLELWGRDGTRLDSVSHSLPVRVVEYSRDSSRIAAALTTPDEAFEIDDVHKTVELYRVAGDRLQSQHTLVHGSWVDKLGFSDDGALLATLGRDRTLKLWSDRGVDVRTLSATDFAFGEEILVTGDEAGTVTVWRVENGDARSLISFDNGAPISSLALSPDGLAIATGDEAGTVRLWTWKGGVSGVFEAMGSRLRDLRFSPNGAFLVSVSEEGWVRRWMLSGEATLTQRGTMARWSADGRFLAISGGG